MSYNRYQDISAEEYQSQFNRIDHMLVDVREPEEFVQAHLPGAINIPLNDLMMRAGEIPNQRPVVLVCARGNRSAIAAEALSMSGYTSLYNLEEGTIGWMFKGLPVER